MPFSTRFYRRVSSPRLRKISNKNVQWLFDSNHEEIPPKARDYDYDVDYLLSERKREGDKNEIAKLNFVITIIFLFICCFVACTLWFWLHF